MDTGQEYEWAARAWWRRAMLRRMLLAWRAAARSSRTWGRVLDGDHCDGTVF